MSFRSLSCYTNLAGVISTPQGVVNRDFFCLIDRPYLEHNLAEADPTRKE